MTKTTSLEITVKESSRGFFTLRVIDNQTGQKLSTLLFKELLGDRILIEDLYTTERAKGYGTFAVNAFIQYCQEVYLEDIIISGHPQHPQSLEEDRRRRNKFWEGFGFKIILNQPDLDDMEASLSRLSCKTNQYFQPLHQCKVSVLRHQTI